MVPLVVLPPDATAVQAARGAVRLIRVGAGSCAASEPATATERRGRSDFMVTYEPKETFVDGRPTKTPHCIT